MSIVYLPTSHAPSSRASSYRHDTALPYSARSPSHRSHSGSNASSRPPSAHSQVPTHHSCHNPSHHTSRPTSPIDRPGPITTPIREGPEIIPPACPCSLSMPDIMPHTRPPTLHLAKHIVDVWPTTAEHAKNKLTMIGIVRHLGVDCTDIGLSHWGPLTPDPDRYKIPDMAGWTVRAQLDYYLNDFADSEKHQYGAMPAVYWREAARVYTILSRAVETMGCSDCKHDLRLEGNLGGWQAKMETFEDMTRCHDRRAGHRYAPGCCGNGAYLVDGDVEMVKMAESTLSVPRERFVFREGDSVGGGGSRSGSGMSGSGASASDGSSTAYLSGPDALDSRHGCRRSDRSDASSRRSGTSSQSKYDRSEASGWLKPTARSVAGVPASVAGSGRSEGDTSSILPGESHTGYAERREDSRKRGRKGH